jgi:hypothetical protein
MAEVNRTVILVSSRLLDIAPLLVTIVKTAAMDGSNSLNPLNLMTFAVLSMRG